MKKYKLVKCYPGSLKLGTEVTYSIEHGIYNYNGGDFFTELPKHQVENLPEYWQLVEEPKEYEILEFRRVRDFMNDNNIWKLQSSGDYFPNSNNHGCNLNTMLNIGNSVKDGSFIIQKVKVLSTGLVFQIGDKVQSYQGNVDIISELRINKNSIYIATEGMSFGQNIKNIEHYIEPKLITEDGVEVTKFPFMGSWVWKRDNKYTLEYKRLELIKEHITGCLKTDGWLFFASETKAQEFVDMKNPKVLFTTLDGVEYTEETGGYFYIEDDIILGHYTFRGWRPQKNIVLRFSTHGAALSYRDKKNEEKLLDSKVLSYFDVANISKNIVFQNRQEEQNFERLLKELVKSK